jgi:hypothetical protein
MRIAILDAIHHVVGLKLLFPEADYYRWDTRNEWIHTQEECRSLYNFEYKEDISQINSDNYDIFIVVFSIFDRFKINTVPNDKHIYDTIMNIINNNNFKKILFFDNYDYDYDPNDYIQTDKQITFFKRCYVRNKQYKSNVFSFPFIIFGRPKDVLWKILEDHDKYKTTISRKPHIHWSGGLYVHNNDLGYPIIRNRFESYQKIHKHIINYHIPKEHYIQELATFQCGADILGCGEPNIRTLELLIARTLIIQEKNNLQWPFEKGYLVPPELMFDSEHAFVDIKTMLQDPIKYTYYIDEQNRLFDTYFTKEWLRTYIEQSANIV